MLQKLKPTTIAITGFTIFAIVFKLIKIASWNQILNPISIFFDVIGAIIISWAIYHFLIQRNLRKNSPMLFIGIFFMSSSFTTHKVPDSVTEAYIKRFYKVAQSHQRKFGIPASILLAQGIIHSGSGTSDLVKTHKNHFDIMCSESTFPQESDCEIHLPNGFTQEKDAKYKTDWDSWRDYAIYLYFKNPNLERTDSYEFWANRMVPFSQCPHWDILKIIRKFKLYKYDQYDEK